MWDAYRSLARQYDRLSLAQERRLIAKAQRGSKASTEELVLRHIGFVMFRIRERVYPEYRQRLGEDLLSDAILLLYQKIPAYNLRYRDRTGRPKPVRFSTYIWKRVDGFIIDTINRELRYVRHIEAGAE